MNGLAQDAALSLSWSGEEPVSYADAISRTSQIVAEEIGTLGCAHGLDGAAFTEIEQVLAKAE